MYLAKALAEVLSYHSTAAAKQSDRGLIKGAIVDVLSSVTASSAGNSVTAIEALQNCLLKVLEDEKSQASFDCLAKVSMSHTLDAHCSINRAFRRKVCRAPGKLRLVPLPARCDD